MCFEAHGLSSKPCHTDALEEADMEILDALAARCDAAEAFTVESESASVTFEAGKLRRAETEESRGVAARVMRDGRLGSAATSDMTRQEQLVENALQSAEQGDEVGFEFARPHATVEVDVWDDDVAALGIDDLAEAGREMVEIVREADPEVQITIEIERSVRRVRLATTLGLDVETRKTPLSAYIMVERVRDDDVLMTYDYCSGTTRTEEHLALARRVADWLELAKRDAKMESGAMPVLLTPAGATILGLPLMEALNGKNVWRGVSPLAERLDDGAFAEAFTLVDDATIPGRPGSGPFDDEGTPSRRTPLIEDGVVRSFYYDLKTADQASAQSTGNGSRSLFNPPSPSPNNLVIAEGDATLEEMIGGIKLGLLADGFLGLGQGNVLSGAFSNSVSLAYKIENGEVVGRVKDVSVSGNVYEDLRRIEALESTSRWVWGGMKCPHILLGDVNVTAK